MLTPHIATRFSIPATRPVAQRAWAASRVLFLVGLAAAASSAQTGGTSGSSTQTGGTSVPVEIPKQATALEGVPRVRIDSTEVGTSRTLLGQGEASEHRLQIQVRDGKLFWASQGNVPLTVDAAGGYTYLSSAPGRYIRLTRVQDRISYVEHLDMAPGHVTYWGELRIVLGQ